jgi:carbon-monoxide dehydrogenase medium subunit
MPLRHVVELMKPPAFEYHAPETIEEVVGLLSSLENSRLLAGGQSLMPMLNMRYAMPDHLIDLNRVQGLSQIALTDSELRIGAMTRQRDIEFSSDVAKRCPIFVEAIRHVGHRQTRNRGTIGGSLCHLDPSAEMVTLCALFDATVTAVGPGGTRTIPFAEFPTSFMTSSLLPDECLTAINIHLWPQGHGFGFVEFARRHGDFALVSAAALLELDRHSTIKRAALALGGVGYAPLRMPSIEKGLIGRRAAPALWAEAARACGDIEALEDVHASPAYRRRLAVAMARRALAAAGERALAAQTAH